MDRQELQKLRDLPIEAVAERLGLRVVRHKSLCPFHEDSHPSLSFRVSKNTFRCFVCGASGGTIDLVMRHLHLDFKAACHWLSLTPTPSPTGEGNGLTPSPSPARPLDACYQRDARTREGRERSEERPFDASRYERYFEHPFLNEEARKFLFEERRIDPRVVRWCRLSSWKDKQGVPWLQIPYYDREGRLVGVQNRNLVRGALPRFRFPSGSQCGIYNLPVLNLLKPGEQLFITEGCSDCWAMLSAGHKAIAIPSATLLTKKDMKLLNALNSSPKEEDGRGCTFHMFPDRDAPGERLFLQLQKVLPTLQHHQLPPGCKDYSEYFLKLKIENGKLKIEN